MLFLMKIQIKRRSVLPRISEEIPKKIVHIFKNPTHGKWDISIFYIHLFPTDKGLDEAKYVLYHEVKFFNLSAIFLETASLFIGKSYFLLHTYLHGIHNSVLLFST